MLYIHSDWAAEDLQEEQGEEYFHEFNLNESILNVHVWVYTQTALM